VNATSKAKLVRAPEGVKAVVQDDHVSVRQRRARRNFQFHRCVNHEKNGQEWRDFLVSLALFGSQRTERLRVSAEITMT
jgi:hypothetical protein